MHLDLVTPEKQLLSEEVVSVQIPGMDGDMTVLGDHAPLVTTLRPGMLVVNQDSGSTEYMVTGGFAEISSQGTSILAESALKSDEVPNELLEATLEDAQSSLETATDDLKLAALQRVNDLKDLIQRQGA